MKEEEYSVGGDNCPYSWLNEWLCEYVDGTMDPSLRRVFDKYVQANPELQDHVERLHQARELLCRCRHVSHETTSGDVRARVRQQVECDLLRTPASLREAVRERPVAVFTSTLVVALVVGMFAGATLFAPEPVSSPSVSITETSRMEERPPVPGRAASQHSLRSAKFPAVHPTSLLTLMEYPAGMSYPEAVDSMTSAAIWHSIAARP